MLTFGRSTTSTRSGSRGGIVVDGAAVVASMFNRKADGIRPRAAAVVVKHAGKAADRMKERTTSTRIEGSITSDGSATTSGTTVYADAGPDRRVSNQAWIARFLEAGTVKMAPQPFAQPSADETLPGFVSDMRDLL